MSLLSRNTGGGRRRVATTAAVFAGTLLVYLVVTAVPSMAAVACAAGGTVGQTVMTIGTDDRVILVPNGDGVDVSVNGTATVACPGLAVTDANTDWLDIQGSNAGAETLRLYDTENTSWDNFTTTVNLGNGVDTLMFDNGAISSDPAGFAGVPDAGSFFIQMRQAGTAIAVDMTGSSTSAEARIDNAETMITNGSGLDDGLCASRTVAFPACNNDLTTQTNNIVATTGDNITLPATAPVTQGQTLNGGAGNDVLASGNGNDNFLGGAGSDSVSYEASAGAMTVDLALGTATGMGTDTLSTDVQDVWGSTNNDTLLGNALDNNIFGDDGDDTIDGREGNDGGTAGSFTGLVGVGLVGGDSGVVEDEDTITDGVGNDVVHGGPDDDIINQDAAANGADNLHGGSGGGCDTINYALRTTAVTVNETTGIGWGAAAEGDFGGGFELINSGTGDDTLVGDGSNETFKGDGGNDTVDGNGNGGFDPCNGTGFDYLDESDATAGAVFNLITGSATGNGTDTFSDMEGYIGGPADDSVVIGDTNSTGNTLGDFPSDGGIDTIDASARTLNLDVDLADFGFDCSATVGCLEVENVQGGSGNDTIFGNGLNNSLFGNDGVDLINGFEGNDFIEGGAGNDLLNGGNGGDSLSYKNAPSGVEVDNQLGFASGGDGEDAISFFEIVLGSDFNDTIIGGQNSVNVNNKYKGRGGNDILTGTNSIDVITGGGGNDQIRSAGGDDIDKGNKGNDLILAGNGNDVLNGGKGNDTGNGQQGFDTCTGIEHKSNCES